MINNFVLIIGAMKCGTTSLFQYLAKHPQVCPCEPRKEPNFFEKDSNFSQGFEWYQSLWDYDPSRHKIALEGSTQYTKMRTTEVVDRIYRTQSELNANFRFIYVVRDPIARIESHYTNSLSYAWGKSIKKLDDGIDHRLLEVSRYAKQISEYYQRFPKSHILLLDFNDLKSNPPSVLKQVCEFLGIDSSFEFKDISQNYNSTKGKIIDGSLWPAVEPIAKYLPAGPRSKIRRTLGRAIEGNIKLSTEQRAFVLKELRDDLQTLQQEHGIDIARWGIEF